MCCNQLPANFGSYGVSGCFSECLYKKTLIAPYFNTIMFGVGLVITEPSDINPFRTIMNSVIEFLMHYSPP